MDIFLNYLIQFYLTNTINLRHLTHRIISCYNHKMAIVSWPLILWRHFNSCIVEPATSWSSPTPNPRAPRRHYQTIKYINSLKDRLRLFKSNSTTAKSRESALHIKRQSSSPHDRRLMRLIASSDLGMRRHHNGSRGGKPMTSGWPRCTTPILRLQPIDKTGGRRIADCVTSELLNWALQRRVSRWRIAVQHAVTVLSTTRRARRGPNNDHAETNQCIGGSAYRPLSAFKTGNKFNDNITSS